MAIQTKPSNYENEVEAENEIEAENKVEADNEIVNWALTPLLLKTIDTYFHLQYTFVKVFIREIKN